jgi:hypothetical protein
MDGRRVVKSDYDKARKRVEEEVPKHIGEWAAAIGLRQTDIRFKTFREDMTETLHACMRAHIADEHNTYKRFSDLRKDFMTLARVATAAANQMRKIEDLFRRMPPMHHDPAFRLIHDPHSTAIEQKAWRRQPVGRPTNASASISAGT